MKLREFLDVVNRFDNTVEVRTGNDWYYDKVLQLERIRNVNDSLIESEYLDYEVDVVEAIDYLSLLVWIYKKEV